MATLSENIELYEQQTKDGISDPLPYDRLMIYYRKQKEYRKELQLINKALKIFSEKLKKQTNQIFEAAQSRTASKKLMEKFGRSVGLLDKKGNLNYLPEPLARWTKRKKTVEQKIKRNS